MSTFSIFLLSLLLLLAPTFSHFCPCICRTGTRAKVSSLFECLNSEICTSSPCIRGRNPNGFQCCDLLIATSPQPTPVLDVCPCFCRVGRNAETSVTRQCGRLSSNCQVSGCMQPSGRMGFECCQVGVPKTPSPTPLPCPCKCTTGIKAMSAIVRQCSKRVGMCEVAGCRKGRRDGFTCCDGDGVTEMTVSMSPSASPSAIMSPSARASTNFIVTPSMSVSVTPSMTATPSMIIIETQRGNVTMSPSASPSIVDDGAFCVDVETAGDVYLARSRSTGIMQVDCVCPEITGAGFFDVALFAGIDSGCVENCIELDLELGGSCLAGTTSSEGTGNVVSRCCAECGGTRDDFQLGGAGLRSCVPVEAGRVVFGDAPVGDVLAGCEISLIRGTFGVEAYCRCKGGDGSTLQKMQNLDVLTGQQPGCIITCMEDIQPMCRLDEVTGKIVEELSFELFYCCDQCGGTVDPDAKVCLSPVDPPPVCVDADQSADVYFGVEIPSVLQIDCICPMRSTTASPDILVFSGVQTDCIETCVEQSAKLNSACAAQTVTDVILDSVINSCCTFCLGNISNIVPGLIACAPAEGDGIEFGEPPSGDILSGCETSVFLNSFGVDAYCRCKREDGIIVSKNQGLFVFDGPSSTCIKLCMRGLPPTCSIGPAALDVTEDLLGDYTFCCEVECGGSYDGSGISPACF